MIDSPHPDRPASPNHPSRQCFKCNFEAVSGKSVCPKCGSSKFLTSANIRTRGTLLVAIGIFLAGMMGTIAILIWTMLFRSTNPETVRKVNQEIYTFAVIYLLFGAVIVFGFHSIVLGTWMIVAGRRSRVLVWVMWVLLFAVLGVGFAVGTAVSR